MFTNPRLSTFAQITSLRSNSKIKTRVHLHLNSCQLLNGIISSAKCFLDKESLEFILACWSPQRQFISFWTS